MRSLILQRFARNLLEDDQPLEHAEAEPELGEPPVQEVVDRPARPAFLRLRRSA